MSGNPFKSITHYTYKNNETGITIYGSGIVVVTKVQNNFGNILIDDNSLSSDVYEDDEGKFFIFNSKVKLYTNKSSGNTYQFTATVCLFN